MKATKSHRISRIAFATFAFPVLLVAASLTPQGHAFAQTVIHFFTKTESTTLKLEPSQIPENPEEESDLTAPTAAPLAPLISVAEAEAKAGFEVVELPSTPEGFNFPGIRLYGEAITLEYEAQGCGGSLIIKQSPDRFYQSEWDRVPVDASNPVKIGDLDAEFVQGMFVVFAGDTSATWNPDAPILRLRWIKDGIWFKITKFGDVEAIEYLDQAGMMIALAESLIYTP